MKINLLLVLSFLCLHLWADTKEFPQRIKSKRVSEIFQKPERKSNQNQASRAEYRVANQMMHYWNGDAYDTNATYDYYYNVNNQVSDKVTNYYTGVSFDMTERQLYFYDEMGRDTAEINQFYSPDVMEWVNTFKSTTVYDAMGNVVFNGYYNFNELGNWELSSADRSEYEYNTLGDVVTIKHSGYWDGNWEYYYKELFEYNSQNQQSSLTYQEWDGSNWVKQYREEYTYTNNEWTELTSLYWEDGTWIPEYLYSDIVWYNFSEEKVAYFLEHFFDGSWIISARGNATYNINGQLKDFLFEEFDGSQWYFYSRERYEYDGFYHMTLYVSEEWNGGSWDITWGDRFTFEYNAQNKIAVEYYSYWDYFDNEWQKHYKLDSWYEEITSIAASGKTVSLKAYPNPVANTLNLELNKFDAVSFTYNIIDINGRTVQSGNRNHLLGNTHEFDVSNLKSGIYVLQVINGKNLSQLKFMKQ